ESKRNASGFTAVPHQRVLAQNEQLQRPVPSARSRATSYFTAPQWQLPCYVLFIPMLPLNGVSNSGHTPADKVVSACAALRRRGVPSVIPTSRATPHTTPTSL